ncbi:hypothetical protein HAX54_027922 [Datura stramonium]|uniref:Methyltransferase-like protein 6 n=1 Tax=Datura stramonium TaxID=4076 RepID=A0ABS8V616_DATST|nr:hypothetical protein [Datura stramonium]
MVGSEESDSDNREISLMLASVSCANVRVKKLIIYWCIAKWRRLHKDFDDARVNAFVCDLTVDDLIPHISPSSVDVVTMIFVLSAVSPDKMSLMLQNIKKVLKKDGCVLFRDYATGDLAQERLTSKEQKISDNFYVRGDGTRAFYFSDEFLVNLFNENGFDAEEHILCFKQVENRSRELVMNSSDIERKIEVVEKFVCLNEKYHFKV